MGVILTKFRRSRTALEELELIEDKINDIENYQQLTEQRQRSVVGKLVIYSVGLYVLGAAVFYFCFFPATLRDRVLYIIPLVIFPAIVILLKKVISWFYIRRMTKQFKQLHKLKSDKQRILNNVMERETYRVARTILERFAPDQLRSSRNGPPGLVMRPASQSRNAVEIRTNPINIGQAAGSGLRLRTAQLAINPHSFDTEGPHVTLRTKSLVMQNNDLPEIAPSSPSRLISQLPIQVAPLPRPVLPREPGLLDRMVEGLVGDGQSQRYALICNNCHGHNGMALREEFAFLSFRCCYCTYYNHATQQRPVPPRILDQEDGKDDRPLDAMDELSEEAQVETESDSDDGILSCFEEIEPGAEDSDSDHEMDVGKDGTPKSSPSSKSEADVDPPAIQVEADAEPPAKKPMLSPQQ